MRAGLALANATYIVHALLLSHWVIGRHPRVYARWREAFGVAAVVHVNLGVVNMGKWGGESVGGSAGRWCRLAGSACAEGVSSVQGTRSSRPPASIPTRSRCVDTPTAAMHSNNKLVNAHGGNALWLLCLILLNSQLWTVISNILSRAIFPISLLTTTLSALPAVSGTGQCRRWAISCRTALCMSVGGSKVPQQAQWDQVPSAV